MFNELTMTAPLNMVTSAEDSIENVGFVGAALRLTTAVKRFFSIERCLQIIATAAVLDVVILLFVLNSLTVSGGAGLNQIFAM